MTNSEILQGIYDARNKLLKSMPLKGTLERDALDLLDALIEEFKDVE